MIENKKKTVYFRWEVHCFRYLGCSFIVPLSEQMQALRGTVSLASTIYGIIAGLCAPFMLWAVRKFPLKNVMSKAISSMPMSLPASRYPTG